MKKLFWPFIVIAGLLVGCRGVTIDGELSALQAGEIISCQCTAANQDDAGGEMFTAAADQGGKFRLHIPMEAGHGDWYKIWIGETPQPDNTRTLYLEPGTVQIRGSDGLADATCTGDQEITEYNDFLSGLKQTDSLASVSAAQGVKLENPEGVFIAGWIDAHPSSPLGTALLDQYKLGPVPVDTIIAEFNRRRSEALNNLPAQRLQDWIRSTSDVTVSKIAPDFTMQDTVGRQVSLKDFRGKYVLLDFWASWCGPCRAENPNVLKAFELFKGRGFTVLGVSLDAAGRKDLWLNAIRKDGLSWTQVSDLQYFNSAAAKLYHITAIPANFLIDPAGVIIARNLRGQALEDKLAEVLKP